MRKRLGRNTILWILLAAAGLWVAGSFVQRANPVETLAISELLNRVDSGQVASATV